MSELPPSHFHFSAEWIQAEVGRNAAQAVSAYMQRTSVGINVSNYMDRSRKVDNKLTRESEVAHYFFNSNGLDIDAKAVWAEVDQLSHNRYGLYKTHAGKLPRLGIFITASIPFGSSKEDAIAAAERFAQALIDKYGCAVEGVIHAKNGEYDHAHFAVVDRKVGPAGIGKTKIRELNGVAMKAEGRGVRDKGKNLAPAMEWMRASWAAETRQISGNKHIDHRSFRRQGVDLKPVTYVPRGEIEHQKRHGKNDWREGRARELTLRDLLRMPPILIPTGIVGRKRPETQRLGVMAAAKMLAEKLPSAAAVAVAQCLGGLTLGCSAVVPALLARRIADHVPAPEPTPAMDVPAPIILPRPPRKREPARTLGVGVAAKLLSQHQDGPVAIKLAGALGRMTRGRSALAPALVAKAIDDRLGKPEKAPTVEMPPSLILPQPPRKRQPDQTLGVRVAAGLLGQHLDGPTAIKLAGVLGRMTQGRSALAAAVAAKAIADQIIPSRPSEPERPQRPESDQRPSHTPPTPSYLRKPDTQPISLPSAARVAPPVRLAAAPGLIRPLAAVLAPSNPSLVPPANISIRQAIGDAMKAKREAARNTYYDIGEIALRVNAQNEVARLRHIAKQEEELRQSQIKTIKENDELRRRMSAALKPESPHQPDVDKYEAPIKPPPVPGKFSPQISTPLAETDVPEQPPTREASPSLSPEAPPPVMPREEHVRIVSQYAAFLEVQHKMTADYMRWLADIAGMAVPDLERRAGGERGRLFSKGSVKRKGFGTRLAEEADELGFSAFVQVREEINKDILEKRRALAAKSPGASVAGEINPNRSQLGR
jgi:hypothetical protein